MDYNKIIKCVDVKREMGYDKNAVEMTIVVTLLLFLYRFDEVAAFMRIFL